MGIIGEKSGIRMSIVEMHVPTIGESVSEVTLSQWLKEDGAFIKLDEPICEFESDKATLEFPAEATGKLIYVAAEGDDLEIGALVAKIDTSVSAPAASDEPPAKAPSSTENKAAVQAPATSSHALGHPSPAAAKILREKNITPAEVEGSGKGGRITKSDAEKAQAKAASTPSPTLAAPVSNTSFSRETSKEKMSRMRRTIARRLVSAKNNTAMLTTFNELDMTAIIQMRKTYQERFVEKYGVKLGFMSLFAKACAKVLMDMPNVNAILDDESLIMHDFVDISFAISTPNGLVVPPIKNVESLRFHEIELKLKELAGKARNGTLTLDEMKGGTFAITNGGVFGSMMSTPILNEPQSAILGMHNIVQRPIAINGEVVVRPMMYLALSYDHRVIDGSSSVSFLVKVKKLLEDPTSWFLDI